MLQILLNRALELDPSTKERLKKLQGRFVAIDCTDLPINTQYCSFENNQIQLQNSIPDHIDLSISGTLQDFVHYAINRKSPNLEIKGDAHVAAIIEKLYLNLSIDWEEELSKLTGDAIAHQAMFYFKKLRNYAKDSTLSLGEMIAEYLQEETYTLPTRAEVDAFMNDIDELRLRVDRLEARIKANACD